MQIQRASRSENVYILYVECRARAREREREFRELRTYIHPSIHTYIPMCVHTYIHRYTCAHMQRCTHSCIQMHMHANAVEMQQSGNEISILENWHTAPGMHLLHKKPCILSWQPLFHGDIVLHHTKKDSTVQCGEGLMQQYAYCEGDKAAGRTPALHIISRYGGTEHELLYATFKFCNIADV